MLEVLLLLLFKYFLFSYPFIQHIPIYIQSIQIYNLFSLI